MTHFEQYGERCRLIVQKTDESLETTIKDLNTKFAPAVLLVNHEKKFFVDSACSNLAIKYNMIYISAYQVIRENILANTPMGRKLKDTKKDRELNPDVKVADEFQEHIYSPVHYDPNLVKQLISQTISEKRTNQKYVILEAFCNSKKLADVDDQIEFRYMDELFAIEQFIGEVKSIIAFQTEEEPEMPRDDEIEYEKFPEPPPVEEKPQKLDEDGNPIVEEEEVENAEENEGPKVPVFKPEDYKWQVTNRKPTILLQLYRKCKGVNTFPEVEKADMS